MKRHLVFWAVLFISVEECEMAPSLLSSTVYFCWRVWNGTWSFERYCLFLLKSVKRHLVFWAVLFISVEECETTPSLLSGTVYFCWRVWNDTKSFERYCLFLLKSVKRHLVFWAVLFISVEECYIWVSLSFCSSLEWRIFT